MSVSSEPRQRLVEAGLDLFSEFGYEAASTRSIADKAGVNISAIKYYFSGKEGLYEAVMEHVLGIIQPPMQPVRERVEAALARKKLPRREARELLLELLGVFARTCVGPPQFNRILLMMVRAQIDGSRGFELMYERVMSGMLGALSRLIATLRRADEADTECRLHAIMLIGQILIFRTGRRGTLRILGWKTYGEEEIAQLMEVVREDVERRFPLP